MGYEIKAVTEARAALKQALEQQTKDRKQRAEKRLAKIENSYYKTDRLLLGGTRYIKVLATSLKTYAYVEVHSIVISSNRIIQRKHEKVTLTFLEDLDGKQIQASEFNHIQQAVQDSLLRMDLLTKDF